MSCVILLLSTCLQETGPTAEEALQFSRGLQAAVATDGLPAFDRATDPGGFQDRVTQGVKLSRAMAELLQPRVRRALSSAGLFGSALEKHTFKLLRIRQDGNEMGAWFRIHGSDSATSYHAFILRGTGEKIRIVDVRSLASGDLLSEEIRRLTIPPPAALQRLNSLVAPTPDDLTPALAGQGIGRMLRLSQNGKPESVLDFFEKQPALRASKLAHILRLQAAAQLDQERHQLAYDEMLKAFPGEPAVHFQAFDGFIRFQQVELAIDAVDHLEKTLGKDPYLDVLRALARFKGGGKIAEALALAQQAAREEPTLEPAWWTLVTIHLREQRFQEVVRGLAHLEATLGVSVKDQLEEPSFAEFLKSPEYGEWRKARQPGKP